MIHDALATYEQQVYEKEHSDMNWFKGKQRPKELDALDAKRKGNQPFSEPSSYTSLYFVHPVHSNYARTKGNVYADQEVCLGRA